MFKNSLRKSSSFFTKHLREVGEGYFTHMKHAMYFAANSLFAAISLIIHAILPFILTSIGGLTIKKLNNIISYRRALTDSATKDRIAIIGFGASGIIAFFNLVNEYQEGSRQLIIDIFNDPASNPGGIPYTTTNFNHLLNVPSYKMGILADNRRHFIEWLSQRGYDYSDLDFVPRKIFGIYLEDIVNESKKIAVQKHISYNFIYKKIDDLSIIQGNKFLIEGNIYNICVLSIGILFKNQKNNFWNLDLKQYLDQKEIHLIGCGLTAFDAAMSLKNLGYEGKIVMNSRSGRVPFSHKNIAKDQKIITPPLTIDDASLPLSQIFKKFVSKCLAAEDWRVCFDSFRPMIQEFWLNLDLQKKKRFIRHCYRIWNIYRHRCPEIQYAQIQKMIDCGKIELLKNSDKQENYIDCTGFDLKGKSDLVKNLISKKVVMQDDLDLGIISNNTNFYIVGGLNFGSLLEITAIPEITSQAAKIAKQIMRKNL